MEHDENNIEEIIDTYGLRNDLASLDIDDIKDDIKQYAEHMVQQDRSRIVDFLKENMTAKNSYNMTYKELIKAINQE